MSLIEPCSDTSFVQMVEQLHFWNSHVEILIKIGDKFIEHKSKELLRPKIEKLFAKFTYRITTDELEPSEALAGLHCFLGLNPSSHDLLPSQELHVHTEFYASDLPC